MDELFVQFDRSRAPTFPLQDGSGDVVALCDAASGQSSTTGSGRVVAQWLYDPYGEVIRADHLHSHGFVHFGHKSLFLERLDAGVTDASSGNEVPRHVPFAHSIYHNRNRVYAPGIGRFLQRDLNASAMTLVAATGFNGHSGATASVQAMDLAAMLGNGPNLYQYVGGNPLTRNDPLGLSYDPFSMVDDYLLQSTSNAQAFLSKMGNEIKAAAMAMHRACSRGHWIPR